MQTGCCTEGPGLLEGSKAWGDFLVLQVQNECRLDWCHWVGKEQMAAIVNRSGKQSLGHMHFTGLLRQWGACEVTQVVSFFPHQGSIHSATFLPPAAPWWKIWGVDLAGLRAAQLAEDVWFLSVSVSFWKRLAFESWTEWKIHPHSVWEEPFNLLQICIEQKTKKGEFTSLSPRTGTVLFCLWTSDLQAL
jgi:hypothetical protein